MCTSRRNFIVVVDAGLYSAAGAGPTCSSRLDPEEFLVQRMAEHASFNDVLVASFAFSLAWSKAEAKRRQSAPAA
jgi:hypothetical protein